MAVFFYIGKYYFLLGTSLRPSFFSCNHSIKEPVNQYGMTKVNKKIISQKPMVNIDKKVKNPRYWSNSNMIFNLSQN